MQSTQFAITLAGLESIMGKHGLTYTQVAALLESSPSTIRLMLATREAPRSPMLLRRLAHFVYVNKDVEKRGDLRFAA